MKITTAANDLELSWNLASIAFLSAAVLLMPDLLYAGPQPQDSSVGEAICWIADNFIGNAGRGIATIGISTIGILALVGRITWTQALIIGTGCSVLFGAPSLITGLGASAPCD